jgi:SSS family solute:Na+ symporter
MILEVTDWIIIVLYFVLVLAIGLLAGRLAGKNTKQFFLGGRNMPWWLLGFSMVATTFSTDTPNLVTDIVRQHGVAGNWVWWAFLITGMVTVFLYAKLWRRLELMTDVEFYELRYSGKSAAFLRGFRAIYLGVFFNILGIASVSLAAIKIGSVMLGLSPLQSILLAASVTVIFSSVGGFRGVVLTDFILFIVAMIGSFAAAYFSIRHVEIGSLSALFNHPDVVGKLEFFPAIERDATGAWTTQNLDLWMTLLVIPLLVQWWSVWYPGSEPGGGGSTVQRMLAAKDERNATGAAFFFNFAHYGLRPWPWILVALASLVVFPTLDSIQEAFPHIDAGTIGHDLAYPAMLTFLPVGWLGLVMASLIAAYMSTVSTQLNWGSSYVTNDFYKRFINPGATEKQLVRVGRISTASMMVVAGWLALQLESALDTFKIILQVGAGTGLLFLLRWFWWRINAFSELAAMSASFIIAVLFKLVDPGWAWWLELISGIGLTTIIWISVTLLTPPTDMKILAAFYRKARPGGSGWKKVRESEHLLLPPAEKLRPQIAKAILAILSVYGLIFGVGKIIYGQLLIGIPLLIFAISVAVYLIVSQTRDRESGLTQI